MSTCSGFHSRTAPASSCSPFRTRAMRARTGRPHGLVLDEAHHMLPETWGHTASTLPQELHETILVTVHPDHVAPAILSSIDVVVAIGHSPEATLARFSEATGRALAWPEDLSYQPDQVIVWWIGEGKPPFAMQPQPGRAGRRLRSLSPPAPSQLPRGRGRSVRAAARPRRAVAALVAPGARRARRSGGRCRGQRNRLGGTAARREIKRCFGG